MTLFWIDGGCGVRDGVDDRFWLPMVASLLLNTSPVGQDGQHEYQSCPKPTHSYIIVHCWVCSLTSSAYAFWANKKCSSTKQLINCIIYFCHKYVKYTSKETFTENSFNRQTFQTPAGQKEQTQSLLICLHVARSLYSLSKAVLIFMHVRCRRDPHVASVSVVPHSLLSL